MKLNGQDGEYVIIASGVLISSTLQYFDLLSVVRFYAMGDFCLDLKNLELFLFRLSRQLFHKPPTDVGGGVPDSCKVSVGGGVGSVVCQCHGGAFFLCGLGRVLGCGCVSVGAAGGSAVELGF